MLSSRTPRVTEGGLKREHIHAPLHCVCGMAVPQLVWVNVETGASSLLSADILEACRVRCPFPRGLGIT